ncbi:related to sorbitol dehydrogenase [Cephalotrichum gorgonifer]|uniref:Related to sorbitol dehydrogenase n=1 Tax=Cephalotrichum gorgonifer TaxID=2041049 RepID=A0AAE8N3S1_9PEZI|nr:related to sorbitol dehydrogenase [Cephalotrichum gorgonifer]
MAPAAMVEVTETVSATSPVRGSKPTKSTVSASVLYGPRDLRLEERTIEAPGAGELQIAVRSTGICGSDVSYFKKFANGDLRAVHPLSLGHESSGVVVGVGPQVKGFNLGDRVALEVGVPCDTCTICRKGRYNLCKKLRFRSSAKSVPHYQGTLQERINHPAQWCHKLPDHVSFDAAALLEPLSVALHAVNRATPAPGSTALVIGAGTVGLLTAIMAQQAGCTRVTIADVDKGRVDYAISQGFATHGFVVPKTSVASSACSSVCCGESDSGTSTPSSGIMTPASIYSQLEGARRLAQDMLAVTSDSNGFSLDEDDDEDGVDISFECTGKEVCMHTSLYATKCGGKVIMVGMGTPIQTLPLSAAHLREVDILGIFRYANTYKPSIRILSNQGKGMGGFKLPSLDAMVTHRIKGLENAKEAFELASRTSDDNGNLVLKVVIEA